MTQNYKNYKTQFSGKIYISDLEGNFINGLVYENGIPIKKLQPRGGETDICVMWNTITGTKDGRRTVINYYLWDEADTVNGISAMARVTGYSAAVGALFLGRGMLTRKGIVPPEDVIQGENYDLFIDELSRRAIRVINQIEVFESDGNSSSI